MRTLRNPSAAAFAVLVLLAVGIGIAAYAVIEENRTRMFYAVQSQADTQDVLVAVVDGETGARGYAATHDRVFLEPYRRFLRGFPPALAQLRRDAAAAGMPVAPQLNDLEHRARTWNSAVAPRLFAPLLPRDELIAEIRGKGLVDRIRADAAQVRTEAERAIDRTRVATQVSIAGGIALIVLFTILLGTLAVFAEQRRLLRERALNAEIEQRNRALEQSNASLREFAYAASHDLQEPLRTVASFSQLLKKRYGTQLDPTASEFIDFLVDAATRMQQLIDDILSYSRVTTHGKALEVLELRPCVDRALANLQTAIAERGAHVEIGPLPTVLGDPGQLAQLFQNLIGNGLKYSSERPEIRVSAHLAGEVWRVCVADNGIGIAPEYHERVFRIFQRLHTRSEYSGTGVGLAICKGIVDRHGGRIWVESAPGRGAAFWFTLPAVPRKSEAVA